MYIKKVIITNIRAIAHFEMEFPDPAGWHVLIGDNGAGKSSVVRAIAFALIGPGQADALRQSLPGWLRRGSHSGFIEIDLERDQKLDGEDTDKVDLNNLKSYIWVNEVHNVKYSDGVEVKHLSQGVMKLSLLGDNEKNRYEEWGENGWFSAGFGPFRRFSGGNPETDKLFQSHPRVGAHLSLFGEDVALTEALEWIKTLDYLRLKEKEKDGNGKDNTFTYNNLLKFINESSLLPHGAKIAEVDEQGIVFLDGNHNRINVLELSDGYRSILSLTFELIRQLVRVYGTKNVFRDIEKGNMQIALPGVVLIDEIDAHLHPTWQTRVGQWFTKYFPDLQFIVTTHSPLVCRACERGSIWRLAAPGSAMESGEITGTDKDRLIYGNILDAYGTDVFGKNTSINEATASQRNRLGELYEKSMLGLIAEADEPEFEHLKSLFPTFQPNALEG